MPHSGVMIPNLIKLQSNWSDVTAVLLLMMSQFVLMPFTIIKPHTVLSSTQSNDLNSLGFVLDFDEVKEPQILKSELFFSTIRIKHYHIGQVEPTEYLAEDISKINFYYVFFPDTKECTLNKMDIFLSHLGEPSYDTVSAC